MKFTVYSDPGHAWVKVPRSLLKTLGIENDISSYSYMRADFAYLEEDCDLYRFHEAYKNHYGHAPEFLESPTNRKSRIRNYALYQPTQG